MSETWLLQSVILDPRAPNRREPNIPFGLNKLAELGVYYRHFDPEELSDRQTLIDHLKEQLCYEGHDTVLITPNPEPGGREAFEANMAKFFVEHIHEDEEARLIWLGSGYFDVRNKDDEWVRIRVEQGDLLILPAGIYHRFTVDTNASVETLRLFKESPKWVAIPRSCEENPVRRSYVDFLYEPPRSIVGNANEKHIIVVRDPFSLDDRLDELLGSSSVGSVVVLYFVGMALPATGGRSWSPDCVAVENEVQSGVRQLLSERKDTTYVQCDVERSTFVENEAHPYRTHPVIQLKGVPTVMILKVKRPSKRLSGMFWRDHCDIVLRTETPTMLTMTMW